MMTEPVSEAVIRHSPQAECEVESVSPRILSAAELEQRQWAAVKKGIYASKSAARLRRERLRPLVARLRRENPNLRDKPTRQVYDLAEVYEIKGLLFLDIMENGVTGPDGDTRRVIADHGRYLGEARALESKLSIGAEELDELAKLIGGKR